MQAQVQMQFHYTDADGNIIRPAAKNIVCTYAVSVSGSIPVPAGTPQGAEVDLPFTGLAEDACFVYVHNTTGQELGMAWLGNYMPNLPADGVLWMPQPSYRAAGKIPALRFFLTQQQAQEGSIVYTVLGH
jgi:hypothetical protein